MGIIYTVKEVAEYLKISATTLYRMAENKKIKSVKVGGQLRFTKKNIAEFINVGIDEINID
ncbi:MAG: helix-turn-helix domain-containing protein [Clostridium sp.]|uniref:helix-turn-helix domain-containing protein n=1 Tax=Clostridium sp. TaxID=1506 RepID=UPI003053EB5D